MEISLQPAFVLHLRAYRESSLIAQMLLADSGRVSIVVHGVRTSKSKLKGLVQPFLPVLLSAKGKGEMKTLTHIESATFPLMLKGPHLLSGLYINELLCRVLQPEQPLEGLFANYRSLLVELASGCELQPVLRVFEKRLLQWLGVAPSFSHQAFNAEPIVAEQYYWLSFEQGFIAYKGQNYQGKLYPGSLLQALDHEQIEDKCFWPGAKCLNRCLINNLLDRPLRARELFS